MRTRSLFVICAVLAVLGGLLVWTKYRTDPVAAEAAMQQPPGGFPPPPQGPNPPQPWPASAPGPYQGPPTRPGSVTAASVLLIVLAVPPIVFGVLAIVGAGLFHTENGKLSDTEFAGLGDAIARIVLVFGIVSLAYGVTKLIAGIRTLAGRNAWRIAHR